MPLSSDDVKRIAAEVVRTFPYKSMAAHVWAFNGIGAFVRRMGNRVLAVYDSVRMGKKGVRTTGDGLADLQSRLGRVELNQNAKLDEILAEIRKK